jgi:riboflavin kinase/FMN adenylyltransferase
VDGLGVRYIVVGDDLRFGHDREGDFNLIREYSSRFGYQVMHIDTLGVDGERVSSTRIRELLCDADFAGAEELLGKPYSISGKVVYGQQYGRRIGVPTANLELHRYRSALNGVYAVEVLGLGGVAIPGVANVGTRPTVGDRIKAILEVHMLDFDRDIYGKSIEVVFRHKIRDERKFDSFDELKQNIARDVETGRRFFGLPHRAAESEALQSDQS